MAETRSKTGAGAGRLSSIVKPILRPQDADTLQMTLLIISGDASLIKLEGALEEAALKKADDLMNLGKAPRKLNIQIIPTLNPKKCFQGQIPSQVDYVVVMLDPTDPNALDTAELETELIDKMIVGRHRVGYYFWEKNSIICEHFHQKLQEFNKKFATCLGSIRFDDDQSVEYNAQLLFNRVHRLTSNVYQ